MPFVIPVQIGNLKKCGLTHRHVARRRNSVVRERGGCRIMMRLRKNKVGGVSLRCQASANCLGQYGMKTMDTKCQKDSTAASWLWIITKLRQFKQWPTRRVLTARWKPNPKRVPRQAFNGRTYEQSRFSTANKNFFAFRLLLESVLVSSLLVSSPSKPFLLQGAVYHFV